MNAVTRDQQNLAIKPLTADHLPQALALSQALNWPYRFEDWAFALSLGVGLAAELDGQLAGTAIWWPYGDDCRRGHDHRGPLCPAQGLAAC
jgi:hypothetical protein